MELLWAISCIILFLYLIYSKSNFNRRSNVLADRFLGPDTLPFFGNAISLISKNNKNMVTLLVDLHTRYGGIFKLKVFSAFAFFVIDPSIIEILLRSNTKYLAKNSAYNLLKPWLNDGLLLSTGKKWSQRRKILTPAFHFSILEQFVEVFDEQSSILVDRLQDYCNGKVINIQPFISLMTLDVICETAMGVKVNAQTTTNKYVEAVSRVATIIANRFAKIWQRSEWLFTIFAYSEKKSFEESLKVLHGFTESVIEKRRNELIQNDGSRNSLNQTVKESDDNGKRSKMALLDVLLRSSIDGKPLTNAEIREEVDTFMFEGHDTTTSGIVFALHLLSRHKPVQDKLYEEITNVIGHDLKAPVTYRQLQSLKYMEAVIKESLRLFPPVPVIGRHLDDHLVLDDGRIIPADSRLNLMLFVMFRSEKYFPEAEKFNPNRFIDCNEKSNPYTFIPFSAGSRNCIGQKFAILEIKSTISRILRHYELLPMGDNPITSIELTTRSKNGIQLGLKRRM